MTLGVLADMWEPNEQEFAVAFLVLSSVGGSVVGAIVGAFVEEHLSLPWIFWIQLILGGFVQIVHMVCNPETRSTILLDREAKRRRKTGEDRNVYGPNEIRGGHKISFKEVVTIFWRYGFLPDFTNQRLTLSQAILHVLHRANRLMAVTA